MQIYSSPIYDIFPRLRKSMVNVPEIEKLHARIGKFGESEAIIFRSEPQGSVVVVAHRTNDANVWIWVSFTPDQCADGLAPAWVFDMPLHRYGTQAAPAIMKFILLALSQIGMGEDEFTFKNKIGRIKALVQDMPKYNDSLWDFKIDVDSFGEMDHEQLKY